MKTISFYITNYAGKKTLVTVPDEIDHIRVAILSGDEIITVYFKHSEGYQIFDSSSIRIIDFYDGGYEVSEDRLQEWIDLAGDTYDRRDHFCGWLNDDEEDE